MKETYEQYQKRMSTFPQEGLTILTEQEWKEATTPKAEPVIDCGTFSETPKQPRFTATELAHMTVLEEQRKQSERVRVKPDDPLAIAWPKVGLSSEEQAAKVKQSSEEALRDIQAREEEDRKAADERQKKLEAEAANAEHAREMAIKALESDRIRAGRAKLWKN
jgi:hypothetical protein